MLKVFKIEFTSWHYAILVVAILVFFKGLSNQFNNWDDTVYVTENAGIQLNSKNLTHSFTKGESHGMYAPLTALSLSVNHYFSGLNPKPYLITNLLIHLLNCVLLFVFLQKLFKDHWLTLFVGALFALHPMQAESVSYVAGRRDLLYVMFFLLSLIQYLNYTLTPDKKYMRYVFLFFILSLLSKGQAIALPFTLVLIDFIHDTSFTLKASLKRKLLFILLSFIFIVITLLVKQASKEFNVSGDITEIPFGMKSLFACYGFMMYIVHLIIPFNLSLIHPYPENLAISASLIISVLGVIAIAFALWKFRNSHKQLVFGVLFFSVNIFLVLQIIPNSYGIMNDHYVYLAGTGIFIALYAGLKTYIKAPGVLARSLCGIAVFMGIICFARVSVFKNNLTVFSDVIDKYPDSFVAYTNRGNAYYSENKLNEALADYDKAISIKKDIPNTLSNRAAIYIAQKRIALAITDLDQAILFNPAFANAYSNRGIAKSMLNAPGALNDLNKAIEIQPGNPALYYNRAGYFMQTNQKELGCADVRRAKEMGLQRSNPLLDRLCE